MKIRSKPKAAVRRPTVIAAVLVALAVAGLSAARAPGGVAARGEGGGGGRRYPFVISSGSRGTP